jgi:glycolate oxidase iron-sulfur subunit
LSEVNLLKTLDYSVLQQCMHCGMCLPTCPTYDETKRERSSPRGRIRLMREVADGRLDVTATFADEMSYCLGCLACQTACPAGVDYATLLENARGEVERRGVVGGPWRRFVRWLTLSVLFRRPWLLRAAGRMLWMYERSGLQSMLRRSEIIQAIVPERLRRLEAKSPTMRPPFSNRRIRPREWPDDAKHCVAVLTGCVQDLIYPHVNRATADVLLANECEVIVPPSQFCCGSLHAHNGELELACDLARRNIDTFDLDEVDAIITNSGGCGSHLKKYAELLHDDAEYRDRAHLWDRKVRDIHEWLVEIGFREPRPANDVAENAAEGAAERAAKTVIAYDASCHLLHGQKIARQPLEILRALPDAQLVDLPESDWCCGSAGIYSLTQPEQSAKLLARKLDHIASTGATVLATGNPGCLLQIELGMRGDARLRDVRICHPVDLLAEAYLAEQRSF